MNAREEHGRALNPYPRGELESPFIEEEIFVGEAEADWGTHLTALEAESPFRHTFEESPAMPFEPEELEEEFVAEEERTETEHFPLAKAEDYDDEAPVELEDGIKELHDEEVSPYAEAEAFSDDETWLEEEPLIPEEQWIEPEEEDTAAFLKEGSYAEEESLDEEFFTEPEEEEIAWETFEPEKSPAIPAGVTEFAVTLGKEWAKRRNGSPPADKITEWLLQDYQETLAGARQQFKKYPGDDSIGRAWMTSRQEQMKFKTSSSDGVKPLRDFQPPMDSVALVSNNSLIQNSDQAPVAPIVVRFIHELRRHYRTSLRVSTRRGHGGRQFRNRGYSLDLFLQGRDDRGFYRPAEAVNFLRALREAARATDAEWRVIYNDFSVANIINRETSQKHVIFIGEVRRDKNKKITGLNWHGPDPLILHFHLDLVPRTSDLSAGVSIPSGITTTPVPSSSAGSADLLPTWLSEIVKSGRLTLQAAWAMLTGQRDVNTLTNMIFYARHPGLPVGYKIKPHEKQLAERWVRIRDDVVKPLLAKLAAGVVTGSSAPTVPAPSPTSTSTSAQPSSRVIAAAEHDRSLARLLDRIRTTPDTNILPRTRRVVVDGYERNEPRADVWCQQAGLTPDEGALARMVASEVGTKPPQYMIAVVEAVMNEARAKKISAFARITMQGLKLKGGVTPKSAGYFGRQSGRWCASIQDPNLRHLEAVRVVQSAPGSLVARDGRRWVDGKVMDSGRQAGKRLTKNAVTVVEKWGAEGWEWIGPVYGPDGQTLLLDPYRLMVFRLAGRGKADIRRGVEAMREGRRRWKINVD